MELYGGNPGHFHLNGMSDTPRETEWIRQLVTQIYRAIMSSELVARKLGHADAEKAIRSLLLNFEAQMGCKENEDPETLMQKAKAPK